MSNISVEKRKNVYAGSRAEPPKKALKKTKVDALYKAIQEKSGNLVEQNIVFQEEPENLSEQNEVLFKENKALNEEKRSHLEKQSKYILLRLIRKSLLHTEQFM